MKSVATLMTLSRRKEVDKENISIESFYSNNSPLKYSRQNSNNYYNNPGNNINFNTGGTTTKSMRFILFAFLQKICLFWFCFLFENSRNVMYT